jgi:UDP-glucose 4-epimerase
MKKALVMGANGYLGRHIAQSLETEGYEITTADRHAHSRDGHEHYQSLDFSDADQLCKLDLDCDHIFFFAGLSGTASGFERHLDYLESNDLALLNLLRHHHMCGSTARIIFPSTRLVYQGKKDASLKEGAAKDPKTIYAQNKLAGEGYLRLYQNRYEKSAHSIFRICVPYGNRFDESYSYGTIGFFLDKASTGQNIPLYGDGSQRRTFTHINDICSVIIGSLECPETLNATFNIGGGDNCSLAEAATLVAEKFSVGVDLTDWPEEERLLESGDTVFDASKLDRIINYSYRYKLSDWLSSRRD